jgi:cytochrome P450
MDPARHSQLRSLVSRAFTPKRIAEVEPLACRITRRLVEKIAERRHCELQHEYAAALLSLLIATMIGVLLQPVAKTRQAHRRYRGERR